VSRSNGARHTSHFDIGDFFAHAGQAVTHNCIVFNQINHGVPESVTTPQSSDFSTIIRHPAGPAAVLLKSNVRHHPRTPPLMHTTALVLFSGGQDSTTCLAQALKRYQRVETIAFDYRQRHSVELDARLVVLQQLRQQFPEWAGKLGEDHLLDLGVLGQVSETSLTRDTAFKMESSGLPNTFVPGRNLLFLTLAAALAYRRGLEVLVTGVCETDFSGYPDCRDDTMKAMQLALSLGMDKRFLIETPLMWIDKADTWRLADSLGGRKLVDLIVEHTHTCYLGDREHRHAWGYGCGACPACELRARGYAGFTGA
jgi:7-cyano-7-deazaguanine synthase